MNNYKIRLQNIANEQHKTYIKSNISFNEYIQQLISNLKLQGRYGTARNYEKAFKSFTKFCGGDKIPIEYIDSNIVLKYNNYLMCRGVVRNTISFYMRILRAVYNNAVVYGYVEQTYPFNAVYTGVDITKKRAVNENVIIKLMRLNLTAQPSLELARDMFVFSYSTRGMAFIDMAFLRKRDINYGEISYIRHKTGKRLTIKMELCMERIISKYKNNFTSFVFPVIYSSDAFEAYKQYQASLGYYNKLLKRLGKMIDLQIPLTSYCARHSWATAARNMNIPISVISAGMGHNSINTTQIYLDQLDNSIIDSANTKVLSGINSINI